MSSKKPPAAVEQPKDSEKESTFRALVKRLEEQGYVVRREKLKQGYGWKTVSGKCRVHRDKVIFVDRKNPLDEQILFLASVLAKLPE